MKFANPKAAAAYAAQPAATPKPRPSIGGPRQAVIPKPNLPIRGVGPNDGGPKPMPSTGGPRQAVMPGTVITQPGFKPLPPGSIGMPGGPGGKTVYNTGPAPMPIKGGHSSFYNSLMGGGAAPSQPVDPGLPVTGNNIGTSGFKNLAPANFQTGLSNDMKKGGKVSSASKRADGIAQRGKTRI